MFRFLVLSALVACAFGNSILPRFESPAGRIVGGHNTTIEKHPHQVSVRRPNGKHLCGGSILESRKVLTAAHCFLKVRDGITIQYGINKTGGNENVISVTELKCHSGFDSDLNVNNDVCVLLLDKDIPFSDSARPIELAKEEPREGAKAVATGWGHLEEVPWWETGTYPDILQEVELKIIDREACKILYAKVNKKVDNTMVCAGVSEGGKDACQGDSGGPLVVDDKLVGVVSWGLGCARVALPGVYADVAGLRDWILKQ